MPGTPGTILKDVVTFIEFIGPEGLVTKSRNASVPAERLPELNAKISHPIELRLKRTVLRDYPNLAGLFVLLRVMDLLQAQGNRLVVNLPALDFWRSLNPTEQYFALLEGLLFQAQPSVLGNERRPRYEEAEMFQLVVMFLSQLSGQWRDFTAYQAVYVLGSKGHLPPWNLFVQQQLGLIEMRPGRFAQENRQFSGGRGWLIGSARLTPWGEAVTWALLDFFRQAIVAETETEAVVPDQGELQPVTGSETPWPASPPIEGGPGKAPDASDSNQEETKLEEEAPDFSEPEAEFGLLQPVFQPYFPEWQRLYERPQHGLRPGTYIFKVRLSGWRGPGGPWRRLAVPADTSLDTLAGAILKAFNFDSDHLYDFRYRDQRGKSRIYNHPFTEDPPFTTDITVGETELGLRDEMVFTFDYGDNWEFALRLERIEAKPSRLRGPKVIESAGKAPEQYPRSEEW